MNINQQYALFKLRRGLIKQATVKARAGFTRCILRASVDGDNKREFYADPAIAEREAKEWREAGWEVHVIDITPYNFKLK
jgi:hypothetical protein